MPSFVELAVLWDGACSLPIEKLDQRMRAKRYILKWMEKGEVVMCFREAQGFLMIAHRRPRLDDYFKS